MHFKLLQPGKKMTMGVYCAVIEIERENWKKWPDLAYRNEKIIHQDNSRLHIAKKTVQKITEFG